LATAQALLAKEHSSLHVRATGKDKNFIHNYFVENNIKRVMVSGDSKQ
jgi:hypothetical protein